MTFYLMYGNDAVDLVFATTHYKDTRGVKEWFDQNLQLTKCIGKMHLPTPAKQPEPDRTMTDLYINEDNQSFYASRPENEMTPEGVDAVVDAAAAFPVTGMAFCINVQRALFESRAWATFYGDYDPAKGLDQPAEWRTHGARNLWLLAQRGVDHHARWLARCRHHGMEGWLSMRMNDRHGLEEYCQAEKGTETHWTRH